MILFLPCQLGKWTLKVTCAARKSTCARVKGRAFLSPVLCIPDVKIFFLCSLFSTEHTVVTVVKKLTSLFQPNFDKLLESPPKFLYISKETNCMHHSNLQKFLLTSLTLIYHRNGATDVENSLKHERPISGNYVYYRSYPTSPSIYYA